MEEEEAESHREQGGGERPVKGRGQARSKGRWRRLNRNAMGHQRTAEKAGFLR